MTTNNPPLKVLHILDHSVPLHSGYACRSHGILRAQLKRGWLPVALTSPKHAAVRKGYPQKHETIDGVRYYRTEAVISEAFPLESARRSIASLARRIRQPLQADEPD